MTIIFGMIAFVLCVATVVEITAELKKEEKEGLKNG